MVEFRVCTFQCPTGLQIHVDFGQNNHQNIQHLKCKSMISSWKRFQNNRFYTEDELSYRRAYDPIRSHKKKVSFGQVICG